MKGASAKTAPVAASAAWQRQLLEQWQLLFLSRLSTALADRQAPAAQDRPSTACRRSRNGRSSDRDGDRWWFCNWVKARAGEQQQSTKSKHEVKLCVSWGIFMY